MKKSFKVRIFWHVIFTTAIVIGANRLTAQHFLTDQLQTRIHQEMGIALDTCEAHFQHPDAFLSCFKALEKGSLFSNISDFYLLCDRVNNASSANAFPSCPPCWQTAIFGEVNQFFAKVMWRLLMVLLGQKNGMPFASRTL